MQFIKAIRYIFSVATLIVLASFAMVPADTEREAFVESLLKQMTLEEKIGQMTLMHSPGGFGTAVLQASIRDGRVGAVLNETRPDVIRALQQAAVEESRLGIPLLFGRDVIHGFRTIFPINIGLAATFNPELVKQGAEVAAREASSVGVNWNFAPMVDISRDPRWGRMAESFGEDPLLVTEMGLAMMKGFQGDDLGLPNTMAACAKHFAGYGAAEGGRDYNTANIPEIELWNTYFPTFKALQEAGVATFMAGFHDLNGSPSTGNGFLLREVLRDNWKYEGFVVSDWASVTELIAHGYAADKKEAAYKAFSAGVDMEMSSTAYRDHLTELIQSGAVNESQVDDAVRRILKVKYDLGLFDRPYVEASEIITAPPPSHLDTAKRSAVQSFVLLKNESKALPLDPGMKKVALIGPMADDRYEQLGTWIFDGDTSLSVTPLRAIRDYMGDERVVYAKGLSTTRSLDTSRFDRVRSATASADAVVLFVGEESIITGEAHSRAYLDLPGAQNDLVREVAKAGRPVILVVMTPRPLTIGDITEFADAVLYAWHPGTMAGPALAEVLFGLESPSGKLPVTFVKAPGQIPMYYAHKNTGRPPSEASFVHIQDIPVRSFQTSLGNTSHYLDVGFKPLYPFGYGLSYAEFNYEGLRLSSDAISEGAPLVVTVTLVNTGKMEAEEVVQLYVRDLVASVTRPVKELKGFKRVRLGPGEEREVSFELSARQLGFYDQEGRYLIEPGEFMLWVGGSSEADLQASFVLK